LIQPDWILDIGFILSFISLASIMLFEKRIEKFLKFIPKILGEGFSVALAAQIGMTPILFVTFGNINIWSPVVSVLTLWIVPYVMILGTVGGIVGLIIPFLGKIILWLSYPMLWWFTKIVTIFNF
jgi:competence protein ComEC